MIHILFVAILIFAAGYYEKSTNQCEAAITTAYDLGLKECPDANVCLNDELGLKRLDETMIEERLR
jgi:hypothetical protein